MDKFEIDKINFAHCEDEPIHIPESIQEYGFFFALNPKTKIIEVYSAHYDQLLSTTKSPLELNFLDLLNMQEHEVDFVIDSYLRAKERNTRLPIELTLKKEVLKDKTQTKFHAVIYHVQDYMIFEVEPHVKFIQSHFAKQYSKIYSANISPKYKELASIDELANSIAETVRKLTGFERVVIYKFNPDNSGHVIAEAKVDDIESYLDLYYPAGDIPKQARELYLHNWIRLTPDVDLQPIPLLPRAKESNRERIDLTKSLVRSMSPIHLQYVRNQGLKSSMSISLVSHGNLWGIISCHHRQKHYIPQNIRVDCEELSQLFSWQLYAKEEELRIRKKNQIETFVDTILAGLSQKRSIVEIFKKKEDEILEKLNVSGFIFQFNQMSLKLGEVPSESFLNKLQDRSHNSELQVWSSSKIEEELNLPSSSSKIKGALYIPLTKDFNCYTAWFREEKIQVQRWTGLPDEKQLNADKKARITPRKSFKVHELKITNQSLEWNKTDLEIAEKFHKIFLSFSLSQQEQMQADISFLEEKDQTKDEFLATLAHELRNPLSPMENAISLIEEAIDPNDENLTSILNILKRQQNQLGVLVNDLLDVSQITRRRLTLKIKDVNLLDLLKGAIETANKLIKSKNQTLKLNFKEDSILIRGDYSRLLQALSNVINNASKYTDENGQILVNCHPNSENVVIEISDNGIGIEKSKLKGIFNMFSQVDANENTRGGLGIGLTLTKKIIDIHDGKIIVESEGLGKGSSFKITLPRSKRLKESSGIQSNSNAPWIKDKNILIVDDNEDIITTLTLILTKKGAKISSALNAEDCLDKFSQSKFDLAILDIGLPDISGYELCKELKVKSSYEHAVFIAQSGWGQKEDKRKSREAGFDLHLTKPVKAKDLIQEVEDFINSKS